MLEAAGRLFATQRYHEVRMEDIAAEAEVGKGTLYRYFGDKDDLYFALLTQASQDFTRRIKRTLSRASGARERLTAMVADIICYFDEHPHMLDLIQRAEVLPRPGKEFPWQQTRTSMIGLVEDLFDEGARQEEFEIRKPQQAALMLLGGLRSVIRFGKRPRPAGLARQIIGDFLEGAARL
jgi:AcrR family transcriptional regulator